MAQDSSFPPANIPIATGTWNLKASHIYMIPFYSFSSTPLPVFAQSHPLDTPTVTGKYRGGIGMIQVLRYSDSNVGPYDEMLVTPGYFDVEAPAKGTAAAGGEFKVEESKNVRVSRIYVSTKASLWNGRRNWNIPKHLASFSFDDLDNGATKIQVFLIDAETEEKSKRSFFTATYRPMSYIPKTPFSTDWARYLGFDLRLVQPPLPRVGGDQSVLVGTKEWCAITPLIKGKMGMGWWDMAQEDELIGEEDEGWWSEERNWWPGWGRWRIGMNLKGADVVFEEGVKWKL